MWNLLAVVALTAAVPADITAAKLDGTTISGRLQSWQNGQLVLELPTGTTEIAESELLAVRLSPPSPPEPGHAILELADGTILPITAFSLAGVNAEVKLEIPAPAEPQTISISVRQVRIVRWQPLDESVAPQWQEIRALGVPNDVLIVFRRGGKSLDYLQGVAGKITDGDVEFTVDGNTNHVVRSKTAGLIFYHSDSPSDSPPPCVLTGSHGLRIAATTVRLEDEDLHITTSAGLELSWPLADIQAADFSAGKLAYLSDLPPAAQSWQPLVGLPAAATHAAKYGQPRFDQSATGGPLTLWYPDREQPAEPGHLESFAKGMAIRSRTELTYRLPRGYSRFLAVAGIEPSTSATGNVALTIYGDDRVLVEAPIAGNAAPLPIELSIENVRRLKIVVDYGQNLDTGDWLNLCNARVVK